MKNPLFPPYSPEVEAQMLKYSQGLSEKGCREYAALESLKLPYGGKAYIMRILGISSKRLLRGLKEIQDDLFVKADHGKIRLPGGGRKKKRKIS